MDWARTMRFGISSLVSIAGTPGIAQATTRAHQKQQTQTHGGNAYEYTLLNNENVYCFKT